MVPSDKKFNRQELERIIRRAAELQANEREIGEGLDERELMALGKDVGIPGRFLQQAVAEERFSGPGSERGITSSLLGPAETSAQRTVAGERADIEANLMYWMTELELLTVKRRFPNKTTWEPRNDMFASLKRGFGLGGRKYLLSRAQEVMAQVLQLEDGWCHVLLRADLRNSQRSYAGGSAGLVTFSGAAAGVAFLAGVAMPLALVPVPFGIAGGWILSRSRRSEVEKVQVALEQILDRLERGEIKPPDESKRGSSFGMLAEEFKKSFVDELAPMAKSEMRKLRGQRSRSRNKKEGEGREGR